MNARFPPDNWETARTVDAKKSGRTPVSIEARPGYPVAISNDSLWDEKHEMNPRTSDGIRGFPACREEEKCQSPAMASITGFHHTAIRSVNFDASVRFYTEVLGMEEKISWGEAPSRAIMIDAGDGNYVEIFERSGAAFASEAVILHFALRTDDCAAMLEKARASGAEVTMETKDLTIDSSIGPVPVRIAFFKGPDGEIIELFQNTIL
jgi:catechol 2,3-dioxygenase-like lactoylglutathione lyase family enzyme